jgi:hypothetical protein
MGYWVNTAYLHGASVADTLAALEILFAAEGMRTVCLPERERSLVEPMQYDRALRNDLWGAAVFPGSTGWVVIQTAPLELLAERVGVSGERRIQLLCRELNCSAILLNVYDSSGVILAECSSDGAVSISGFNGQAGDGDPYDEHHRSVSEANYRPRLELHSIDVDASECSPEELSQLFASRFGGLNAQHCDNFVSVDTLICRKSFTAREGATMFFQWTGASRQRFQPCDSWDEYRAALLQTKRTL